MASTPTEEQIDRVIHSYNLAKEASDYADTIICEMQLITGNDYRMVWSTEFNGGFPPVE